MNILFLCFFSIVDKGFIVYSDNRVLTVGWVYISGTCTKCTVGTVAHFLYGTGYLGIVTVLKAFHQKMCKEYRNPLKKTRF